MNSPQEKDIRLMVVTGGHDYDNTAFTDMLDALERIHPIIVEQPDAQSALAKRDDFDVVFFYDMCGIPGAGLTHDNADADGTPSTEYAQNIEGLLEAGVGLLLANHATVSWPTWPLWRKITGSSFMLSAGELNGIHTPGSGYRGGHGPHPNATVRLNRQIDHPALAGLDADFTITDELYLKTSAYEADVTPLLRADYDFIASNFTAPPLAPPEEQANWDHPPGSNLVVWTHQVRHSQVIVSDLGDGPAAFANQNFRRLLQNSFQWLAHSEDSD